MPLFHLPNEILAAIVAAVPPTDRGTLVALLRVNRATYALAGKQLYADLVITGANLPGVLRGLIRGDEAGSLLQLPGSEGEQAEGSSGDNVDADVHDVDCGMIGSNDRHGYSCPLQHSLPLQRYPSPESDARKRALLAYTTTLSVRSVPPPEPKGGTYRLCPVDKATFPAVRNILVFAPVPYHENIRRPAAGTA
jgi:hypothetical protein